MYTLFTNISVIRPTQTDEIKDVNLPLPFYAHSDLVLVASLVTAIMFHQLFECLSLSIWISSLPQTRTKLKTKYRGKSGGKFSLPSSPDSILSPTPMHTHALSPIEVNGQEQDDDNIITKATNHPISTKPLPSSLHVNPSHQPWVSTVDLKCSLTCTGMLRWDSSKVIIP